MKVDYQLYDEDGKPGEQGVYEYWWVSPKTHRSSWTRPGAARTDWQTADGTHKRLANGQLLGHIEHSLESAFLAPLPSASELAQTSLDRQPLTLGDVKLTCVMVMGGLEHKEKSKPVELGLFPTYCFNPQLPVLRLRYSFGTVTVEFNKIVKFQNRFIAKGLTFLQGEHKLLTATVEQIDDIAPDDAALTPPSEASVVKIDKVNISAGVAVGLLVNKQVPAYPQDAKDARISGTVELQATIGRDGKIYDLRVVQAPLPSMAVSALSAVSHWQYRPYLFNGEPVEVLTTINVIFSLSK